VLLISEQRYITYLSDS